jgi:hypothetical protein
VLLTSRLKRFDCTLKAHVGRRLLKGELAITPAPPFQPSIRVAGPDHLRGCDLLRLSHTHRVRLPLVRNPTSILPQFSMSKLCCHRRRNALSVRGSPPSATNPPSVTGCDRCTVFASVSNIREVDVADDLSGEEWRFTFDHQSCL